MVIIASSMSGIISACLSITKRISESLLTNASRVSRPAEMHGSCNGNYYRPHPKDEGGEGGLCFHRRMSVSLLGGRGVPHPPSQVRMGHIPILT